jgi:hypothetical protein
MPCESYGPTERDWLGRYITEVGLKYNRAASNDTLAAMLCKWCKTHDVAKQSLELQIWWRDHQERDRWREEDERLTKEREALRKQAREKLTDAEWRAVTERS